MIENASVHETLHSYIMEKFNEVADQHGYKEKRVLYNAMYASLEEVTEAFEDVDAVYVNSTTVNINQYKRMLDLIAKTKNIKEIFFADWTISSDEITSLTNTYVIIKDKTCRKILHYIKWNLEKSIFIVSNIANTQTRELVRFIVDEQTGDFLIDVI